MTAKRKTAKTEAPPAGLRLNLGAGEWPVEGWLGVELEAGADVVCDLSVFPWPWADESVGEIIASHMLEHFTRQDGERFVAECWRVLAPGGVLHLAVPDYDKFADCLVSGNWAPIGEYIWRDANWFFGGEGPSRETRREQWHRYAYGWQSLRGTLLDAGFATVTRRGPADFDNPRYHAISLYVDAIK